MCLEVSIPHSEFCLFGRRDQSALIRALYSSFNSSLGILSVRTWDWNSRNGKLVQVSIPHSEFCLFGLEPLQHLLPQEQRFQFLTRNSVCSDGGDLGRRLVGMCVSIPHSEFCLFGLE